MALWRRVQSEEGNMKTDAVFNRIAEIERLKRIYWEADEQCAERAREVIWLGELLSAAEGAERHAAPQSLAGAGAKVRRAAFYARVLGEPPLAAALRRLARDIERREPQRRHLRILRAYIDRAHAVDGGTGLAAQVVPRLESVLAWMLKPRLVYSAGEDQ
jgi:hypothetical protein